MAYQVSCYQLAQATLSGLFLLYTDNAQPKTEKQLQRGTLSVKSPKVALRFCKSCFVVGIPRQFVISDCATLLILWDRFNGCITHSHRRQREEPLRKSIITSELFFMFKIESS